MGDGKGKETLLWRGMKTEKAHEITKQQREAAYFENIYARQAEHSWGLEVNLSIFN